MFWAVKSPVTAIVMSVSETSPLFVSVTCCGCSLFHGLGLRKVQAGAGKHDRYVRLTVVRKLHSLRACIVADGKDACAPAGGRRIEADGDGASMVGAGAVPQVFALIWKSPVTTDVCRFTLIPPVFEIVMFCAAVGVPTRVLPKLRLVGDSTTPRGKARAGRRNRCLPAGHVAEYG